MGVDPPTIKCTRSDLPMQQRKFTTELIQGLWVKAINECKDPKRTDAQRRSDFCAALKSILDRKTKPGWHVLCGENIGYALKKRNKTMGVWKVGEKSTVICYRSPGIEEAPAIPPKELPAGEPRTIRIVRPQKIEDASGTAKTVEIMREFARTGPPADDQAAAQALRQLLIKGIGPIWHVAIGNHFEFDAAEDRRNEVIAMLGNSRVVVFQHEQFEGWNIEWDKIFNAFPYLLLIIFCFTLMLQHRICELDQIEESGHGLDTTESTTSRPPPSGTFLERQLCGENAEFRIYSMGCAALVLLVTNSGRKYGLNKMGRNEAKAAMAETK